MLAEVRSLHVFQALLKFVSDILSNYLVLKLSSKLHCQGNEFSCIDQLLQISDSKIKQWHYNTRKLLGHWAYHLCCILNTLLLYWTRMKSRFRSLFRSVQLLFWKLHLFFCQSTMNPNKKKGKLLKFGWLRTAGGASPRKMKRSNWGTPQPTQWGEEGKDGTKSTDSLGEVANIRLTSPTGKAPTAQTVPPQSCVEVATQPVPKEVTPKARRPFTSARKLFQKFQNAKGPSEVTTVMCPLTSKHTQAHYMVTVVA